MTETLTGFLLDRLYSHEGGIKYHMDRDPNVEDPWYEHVLLPQVQSIRDVIAIHQVLVRPIRLLESWSDEQYVSYKRQYGYRPDQVEEYACRNCHAYEDRDYGSGYYFWAKEGCLTLRTLAQPYADYPNFREEWRL